MPFKKHPIALLVASLFTFGTAHAQGTTDVGTISVEGGAEGTGLITAEDTPKARSTVGRDFLEKQSPASNPYQALALLPAVNTYSFDPTGMFGGGIRVRGFNSDQLGFTIDGAPVNDSGSYSVFPQEYTDTENLCSVFVTQGSTDTDAPHIGASGGNIGLQTCKPTDEFDVTVSDTFGSNNLNKSFVRVNTGALLDKRWKSYLSYSKGMVDKWRGEGRADRQHVDFKTEFNLGGGNRLTAGVLYNYAVNNNFRSATRAQFEQFGKYFDFGLVAPQHATPVAGTAQTESIPSNNYYRYSTNPFRNYIATAEGLFKLSKDLQLSVAPYMWYGYGTGGNQLATLTESTSSSSVGGGIQDLNGDADRLDTVIVYRSNITTTYRPGVTTKFTYQLGQYNTLVAGVWYENARHRQTAPAQLIGTPGGAVEGVSDKWLDNSDAWLRYNNGMIYNNRDQLTKTQGLSYFVTDTILLMNDRLKIVPAFSHREAKREFTNFPNTNASATSSSGNGQGYYEFETTYVGNLPSLSASFALTERSSVFADASRNMKTPGNFTFQNLIIAPTGGTPVFTNGVLTGYSVGGVVSPYRLRQPNVKPETVNSFDLGYRYQSEKFMFSGSVYTMLMLNRIASAFDPESSLRTDYNVGTSTIKGIDLETGYELLPHLSGYTSASYSLNRMKSDLAVSSTATLPTASKQFPDAPMVLASQRLQYSKGQAYAFVEGKYTGRVQTTLVNDDNVPGYAVMNLGAGYTSPKLWLLKNVRTQLNMLNVTSQNYLSLNAGSGSQFTTNARTVSGVTGSSPSFYPGSPFFYSLTVGAQF